MKFLCKQTVLFVVTAILTVVLILSLTACDKSPEPEQSQVATSVNATLATTTVPTTAATEEITTAPETTATEETTTEPFDGVQFDLFERGLTNEQLAKMIENGEIG